MKSFTHCFYCERPFAKEYLSEKGLLKTRDHIIPVSLGGINAARNYVPSCEKCNSLKCNRTLEQFMLHIRFLQGSKERKYGVKYLDTVLKNVEQLIITIAPYRETLYRQHKKNVDWEPAIIAKPSLDNRYVDPETVVMKGVSKEDSDWFKQWLKKYNETPEPDFHEKPQSKKKKLNEEK